LRAAVVVDLDSVSQVDGILGYTAGDMVLALAGERLREALRPEDDVGVVGRGQFACLLGAIASDSHAVLAVHKIMRVLSDSFEVGEREIALTPRIGVAFARDRALDAEQLMRRANAAMQEARKHREGFRVYEREDAGLPALRFDLQADLAKAIEDNELFLCYQPQLDLNRDAIVGAEALLRWNHRTKGFVAPDKLISLADQAGLASNLGLWIVNTALRQCSEYRREGLDIGVSVNMFSGVLRDADFVELLGQAINLWAVPSECVSLEIGNIADIVENSQAIDTLNRLRFLGVRLVIDDFGASASPVSSLLTLPVDDVKIHRVFMAGLTQRESHQQVVRSLIDLAHNAGLRAIAVGVENAETSARLQGFGCDLIQGEWIAPGLPFDQFLAAVRGFHRGRAREA
jgi:diguanylate cyclase (GGDEF)-like protein